ncbi:MAG: hypothetical protein QRY72_04660 [Candidatus Rhabdochlamydia sp.]
MKNRQFLLGLFALTSLFTLSADEQSSIAPAPTAVQEETTDASSTVKKVNANDTDDTDDCDDDCSSTDSD